MPTISFTLTDAALQTIVSDFSIKFEYTPETGLTPAQFARKKILDYIRSVHREVDFVSRYNAIGTQSDQSAADLGIT